MTSNLMASDRIALDDVSERIEVAHAVPNRTQNNFHTWYAVAGHTVVVSMLGVVDERGCV